MTSANRDEWILSRRGKRNVLDPWRPYATGVEKERAAFGEIVRVGTIFLTNRECPWRCLMCDLWKNTLSEIVPLGAIPKQIEVALEALGPGVQHIKLYNSGSFFDPGAIPRQDYPAIARRLRLFEHVIVESHPALVGEEALRFREMRGGTLEVAMGLETVHPVVLPRLNKRMTLAMFARAAKFLVKNRIAMRAFVLVKPPFLNEEEALVWANKSTKFAFDCGASVVSLIPTRTGNGALDALAEEGQFSQPKLRTLEEAVEFGIDLNRGRVFADLWDLARFAECHDCFEPRRARLESMNLSQTPQPSPSCVSCGFAEHAVGL